RFGVAQALLGNPKLIIIDEPTAGLDPVERESLYNLLVSISQNRLVLLSTQIVEDEENLCNYVAIIDQGALIHS
ncbi:ABC transporter ATP-binding protein, partial [Pseudoalteromonas agarivorans]